MILLLTSQTLSFWQLMHKNHFLMTHHSFARVTAHDNDEKNTVVMSNEHASQSLEKRLSQSDCWH